MVMGDRLVTETYIASTVGISQERIHSILIEDLNMRKLSAGWVPRFLTVDVTVHKTEYHVTCLSEPLLRQILTVSAEVCGSG